MFFNTLSGRFLGLTILFVVIAEVLIFVPSIARFRAGLPAEPAGARAARGAGAARDARTRWWRPTSRRELLDTADVLNVVLRRDDVRELVLASPMPAPVAETFDLRDAGLADADARRAARLRRRRGPHHPGDRPHRPGRAAARSR